ncbi:DUF2993 domain-containing protein [Ancylothrix sp. C2]|uniref:LmeA family phospholipid-binding protein n=1 Tax=Ancylothrix sp. D3o TaxID=2953691 RepID=UPI0021BB6A08|nr:DUF2993 domain-containing protein [Ancylothrix sp. D3o]MCT7949547.1 DUF2993 domain-containing protein [Ancylothrix sp. D3o]
MPSGFNSTSSDSPSGLNSNNNSAQKSTQLIAKVLSPAVQLWLRSQLDNVEELLVKIEGGNRQLLSGYIPSVSVSARQAVYQGLHLGEISLTGSNIRINIGQVLKGKPLQILETIPVSGELILLETHLNASLNTPLLANAICEFLGPIFQLNNSGAGWSLKNSDIKIESNFLILKGELVSSTGQLIAFVLQTSLEVLEGRYLKFVDTQLKTSAPIQSNLEGFTLDLGPEVNIQEVSFLPDKLICRGQVNVIPA